MLRAKRGLKKLSVPALSFCYHQKALYQSSHVAGPNLDFRLKEGDGNRMPLSRGAHHISFQSKEQPSQGQCLLGRT